MTEPVPDEGFDEWLDALADGEGYYLECPEGHGSLPPRRVCPHCGTRDLAETPLPEAGEVATYTVVTVATPQFEDDAPYVTAIADFGPVAITGQLRDVDHEDLETGLVVGIGVDRTVTNRDRVVVFEPR
ncbi:MAG: Zn-ribbon domain-containing OB-fold protein [Halorientalis sp.]